MATALGKWSRRCACGGTRASGQAAPHAHRCRFIFANEPLLGPGRAQSRPGQLATVSQIDLPSTLALLLGLPIPFGSLGSALTDVLVPPGLGPVEAAQRNAALTRLNVAQVRRYLAEYRRASAEMQSATFEAFEAEHAGLEREWQALTAPGSAAPPHERVLRLETLAANYASYLRRVQAACRTLWTTFHVGWMAAGIATLAAGSLVLGSSIRTAVGALPTSEVAAAALVAVELACPFSNSFVVHHDSIVRALAAAAVLLACFAAWDAGVALQQRLAGLGLASATALRLSAHVRACREEQLPGCDAGALGWRWAAVAVAVVTGAAVMWQGAHGATSGPARLWRRMLLPATAAGCLGHWWSGAHRELLDSRPEPGSDGDAMLRQATAAGRLLGLDFADPGVHVVWARAVLASTAALVGAACVRPLTVQRVPVLVGAPGRGAAPQAKHWLLTGGPVAFSAPFVLVIAALSTALAIVLQPWAAPGVALLVVQMAAYLELRAAAPRPRDDVAVPWSDAVAWWLFASHHFYGTGHQPALASIQWPSGLVGLGDSSRPALSGALLLWNTFGAQFVVGFAAPLLLTWRHARHHHAGDRGSHGRMGELWLHTDRRAPMLDATSGLIAKLMLLTGLQLLATLAAAGIHRRHLMMWKIFAVSTGIPRGATASGPHRSTP